MCHTFYQHKIQVLQIMLPLRYKLIHLGGSWAQRQVFSLTLIQAAINAEKHSLALSLVIELKVKIIVYSRTSHNGPSRSRHPLYNGQTLWYQLNLV